MRVGWGTIRRRTDPVLHGSRGQVSGEPTREYFVGSPRGGSLLHPLTNMPTSPVGGLRAAGAQIAVNLVSNVGILVVNTAVGLLFTPYLVRLLGPASYGMVPLANTLVLYLGLVLIGINTAVSRFVTFAVERGDRTAAVEYFNTALVYGVVIGGILLGPMLLCCFRIDQIISVPVGLELEARLLFSGALVASCVGAMRTAFGVAAYCRNRLDLANGVGLVEKLCSIGWVVVAFGLGHVTLGQVGAGLVAGALVGGGLGLLVWRRVAPELVVRPGAASLAALRTLALAGMWNTVNAAGSLLFLSVDLILVNKLLGPSIGGEYAAVLQWTVLLRSLATAASAAFGPAVVQLFARGDLKGLLDQLGMAVRLLGLALPLPIGLIAGLGREILELWLGRDFGGWAWLLVLTTLPLSVNLAVLPLFQAQTATNRVRVPALVTIGMGFGNLILALVLARGVGMGVLGVALAGVLTLTAKNLVFTPLYTAYVLGAGSGRLFAGLTHSAIATLIVFGAARGLSPVWGDSLVLCVLATGGLVSALYVSVLPRVLEPRERRFLAALWHRFLPTKA